MTRSDGKQVRPRSAKPAWGVGREAHGRNEARIGRFHQGQRAPGPASTGRIQNCNLPDRHTQIGPCVPGGVHTIDPCPAASPIFPCRPGCRELIRAVALVAVNHSGGKDSQAMTVLLSRIVPRGQIVAVHAPLGEVEWPGTIEHIEADAARGRAAHTRPRRVRQGPAPTGRGTGSLAVEQSSAGVPAISRPDRSSESCADTSSPIPATAGGSSTPWACARRKARRGPGRRRGGAMIE